MVNVVMDVDVLLAVFLVLGAVMRGLLVHRLLHAGAFMFAAFLLAMHLALHARTFVFAGAMGFVALSHVFRSFCVATGMMTFS